MSEEERSKMTREQMRCYLEDENLRKLARQIMASRNAEQIIAAFPAFCHSNMKRLEQEEVHHD